MCASQPAKLKPPGLLHRDGKKPESVSVVPWMSGKCLVWDITCVVTFAQSYRALAVHTVGAVVARAENLRRRMPTLPDRIPFCV